VAQNQTQADGPCGNFTSRNQPRKYWHGGEKVGGKAEECQWHLETSITAKEVLKHNSSC